MLRFVGDRQRGAVRPDVFRLAESTRETFALDLSMRKRFRRKHAVEKGGVWALDCDPVEGRYLLSAGGDGHVYLYDTEQSDQEEQQARAIDALSGSDTVATRKRHQAGATGVRWLPWDTGLFATSSVDGSAKVWDTNTFKPIVHFELSSKVHTEAFSPIATEHCLLAAGCQDPSVRLCDVRSGAAAQTLMGHTQGVYAVAWSPIAPYVLASGSADKTIRLWDIRGAGRTQTLQTFDQFNLSTAPKSAAARAATFRSATAHNGVVNGLSFTIEGLHLLSTGTDGHLRQWDVVQGTNMLVNYEACTNASQRAVYFAVSPRSDPPLVFHPHNGNRISVCNLWEGNEIARLRAAHFETINAIVYHPYKEEAYSASDDGQILAWTPLLDQARTAFTTVTPAEPRHRHYNGLPQNRAPRTAAAAMAAAQQDNWSDDEN